jgi:hypothetical protein
MTQEEYLRLLKQFDWYYEMSDSYDVWRSCRALHDKIVRHASQSLQNWQLYVERIESLGLPDHVKMSWTKGDMPCIFAEL